jgi:transposase-like protein
MELINKQCMSKRMFTSEQVGELSKNENVVKCSEKSITYSQEFKIKAVGLYDEQYVGSREIFRRAGFDLNVIGNERAEDCLIRWKGIFRKKGALGLAEIRGKNGIKGRPKPKHLTDPEKIKYLEAQVAYLKAENDFLAKLRAKRAE